MLNWMLWTKNDLKVPNRKQVNASPNMKLVTLFMNFEFQLCGIFEGLSYHVNALWGNDVQILW